MFKIEAGLPIPNNKTKYPFRSMKVGDSFVILSDNPQGKQRRLYSSIAYWKKALPGRHFVMRCVEGGVRIWRTL